SFFCFFLFVFGLGPAPVKSYRLAVDYYRIAKGVELRRTNSLSRHPGLPRLPGERSFQNLHDLLGRASVAEGMNRFRHLLVILRALLREEPHLLEYSLAIVTDEPRAAGRDGLGASGGVAQDEYRDPQRGGFFLHSPRVGQDEVTIVEYGN